MAEGYVEPKGPGEGVAGRRVALFPSMSNGTGIQQVDIGVCKM